MSTDLARVPRKGRMPRTQPSGELSHEDKAAVLFKSQMCKFIKNGGVCPYGPECHFAHAPQELRRVSVEDKLKGGLLTWEMYFAFRSRPCQRLIKTGSCPYGEKCSFSHDVADIIDSQGVRRGGRRLLCYSFAVYGRCDKENCPDMHDPRYKGCIPPANSDLHTDTPKENAETPGRKKRTSIKHDHFNQEFVLGKTPAPTPLASIPMQQWTPWVVPGVSSISGFSPPFIPAPTRSAPPHSFHVQPMQTTPAQDQSNTDSAFSRWVPSEPFKPASVNNKQSYNSETDDMDDTKSTSSNHSDFPISISPIMAEPVQPQDASFKDQVGNVRKDTTSPSSIVDMFGTMNVQDRPHEVSRLPIFRCITGTD